MKILIYGAGAVGSALGGFLQNAGHEVVLVGREAHMRATRENGLSISGVLGEYASRPRAITELDEAEKPDLVILSVKCFDTEAAARELARFDDGRMKFLHLQNGIGNYEILIRHLDEKRVFTGMIIIGFVLSAPGKIEISVYGGDVQIGKIGREIDAEITELAHVFRDIPIRVHAASRVESHLWAKLLYNAALNPLGAILGVNYGKLRTEFSLAIIRDILDEAFSVASALDMPLRWKSAAEYYEHLLFNLIPPTAEHRPSMLADLEAGRKTEIDFMNGALCRLGGENGIPIPVNETLVRQIKFLEGGF